jgi:hypothetical protein
VSARNCLIPPLDSLVLKRARGDRWKTCDQTWPFHEAIFGLHWGRLGTVRLRCLPLESHMQLDLGGFLISYDETSELLNALATGYCSNSCSPTIQYDDLR